MQEHYGPLSILIVIFVFGSFGFVYFLPTIAAIGNKNKILWTFIVNLLTGWTVAGWILAMGIATDFRRFK